MATFSHSGNPRASLRRALQRTSAERVTIALIDDQRGDLHLASFAIDAPVSSAYTQRLLDWTPNHPGLLKDMEASDYFTPEASIRAEEVWSH